jgi:hypothetical protein
MAGGWTAGWGAAIQVTKKNLTDLVRKLLSQLEEAHPLSSDPTYRTDLVARIVALCSQESYKFVTDFEWYLSVLVVRPPPYLGSSIQRHWRAHTCTHESTFRHTERARAHVCVCVRGRVLYLADFGWVRPWLWGPWLGSVQSGGGAPGPPVGIAADGRRRARQGRAAVRRQADGPCPS